MEDWIEGLGQTICLLLSWSCQAACRHCAYHCIPGKSPIISIDQGRDIIDCARQLPLAKAIAFAGGEPFLHYERMLELSRYVKHTSMLPLAISTNAYWAETPQYAREKLDPLVQTGLRALLVSVDDFHLEFVDKERIEHCVNAAVDLGIECYLQSIITGTSRRSADFRQMLRIPCESPLIKWAETPCIPIGRAEDLLTDGELDHPWKNQPDVCSMLRTWVINPYGDVGPCCGIAFETVRAIGNAFKEPLTDIVNRANADPVLNAIAAYGGPYLLIKLLARRGFAEYGQRTYTGNCHACQTVLSDARAMALIEPELREHVIELIASRAVVHEQRWGSHLPRRETLWVPDLWA
jgi:MoaA/NifB/PqqE/SkfB family radical SAM enzyme